MRNMDQVRAKQALDEINHVSNHKEEYASLAKSLPMMLQSNGLGQTLAFLKSKAPKNPAHKKLYNHISKWLNRVLRETENGDFLDWVVAQNSNIYRQASNEAIEYATWLRRFAEAQGWSE